MLFSIVIGSIFGYIYIQNTISLHKKDLVERAYKISETLSKMWFENRDEENVDKNLDVERKNDSPKRNKNKFLKPKREVPKIVGNINGKAFENNIIEDIRKDKI